MGPVASSALLLLVALASIPLNLAWSPSRPTTQSRIDMLVPVRGRSQSSAARFVRLLVSEPPVSTSSTSLYMSESQDDHSSGSGKKSTGVYARPSAAIERGSGFFIPGLEGSRVRLLFGILALVLTYVNNSLNVPGGPTTNGLGVSEAVAVLAGILLLLQAAVEFGQELGFGAKVGAAGDEKSSSSSSSSPSSSRNAESSAAAAAVSNLEQRISPALKDLGDRVVDTVTWTGATYIALTPASHVVVVSDTGEGTEATLFYALGDFGSTDSTAKADIGAKAAVDEVYRSKGGRISLPADHPATTGLLPESARRCVLLQRIEGTTTTTSRGTSHQDGHNQRTCIVVGSNQLLQAFTKNDLRWLGRLAMYVGKAM